MVTTDDCKYRIVKYCSENLELIRHEFDPLLTDVELQETLKVKNWKRMSKEKDGPCVIRDFDCKPFDDQLRATVTEHSGLIILLTVQGE